MQSTTCSAKTYRIYCVCARVDSTVQDLDLSEGIASAVPNWEDVRLLAPHAELRLLACGQASLIQPHRLRYEFSALNVYLSDRISL